MYTELWVLYQYKTGRETLLDRYDPRNLIEKKVFFDYNEMKNYSGNRSSIYGKIYPDYCSMYDRFVIDDQFRGNQMTQFYVTVYERFDRQKTIGYLLEWFDPNYYLGPMVRGQVFLSKIEDYNSRFEEQGWKLRTESCNAKIDRQEWKSKRFLTQK